MKFPMMFAALILLAGSASAADAALSPAAKRGQAFYHQRFSVSDSMPSCSSCHTDSPLQSGKHAVTGKAIRPLAPAANPERLTDPAKTEKWFGRNCKEVVGRPCSEGEKADFLAFLKEVR